MTDDRIEIFEPGDPGYRNDIKQVTEGADNDHEAREEKVRQNKATAELITSFVGSRDEISDLEKQRFVEELVGKNVHSDWYIVSEKEPGLEIFQKGFAGNYKSLSDLEAVQIAELDDRDKLMTEFSGFARDIRKDARRELSAFHSMVRFDLDPYAHDSDNDVFNGDLNRSLGKVASSVRERIEGKKTYFITRFALRSLTPELVQSILGKL